MLKVFSFVALVLLMLGCDKSIVDEDISTKPIRNETVANLAPASEDAADVDSEQVDQPEPSKASDEDEAPVDGESDKPSEQAVAAQGEDGTSVLVTDHGKSREGTFMYFLASVSLIVALLLAFLVWKLLTWRARLFDGQKFLMPEILDEKLTKSSSDVQQFGENLRDLAQALKAEFDTVKESSHGTREVAMSFQEKIAAQDSELASYKAGYGVYMHRKFIGRFFRVYEKLQKVEGMSDSDRENLNMLFEDAFSEAHAEMFTPQVGAHYPDITHQIEDNPGQELTDDPELDFKIHSIERNGICSAQNKDEIIVKAKVKVYRLKED
mgnify:CR=1 FL=1